MQTQDKETIETNTDPAPESTEQHKPDSTPSLEEMIRQAELLPLTGYVHGGCSPVGMKKLFKTFLDESALEQETILVSGGKLGFQVELAPADLAKLVGAEVAPIAK